ncbi:hypothetical protein [uncultured Jannaschia sp.]|uniref:hypothetical protein n=1 Tax=uncultured Jannaschia sp. TaxID=293347 RepID=UPI002615D750|nr:hypothetical protein [uncultured Jannaschia sp.]
MNPALPLILTFALASPGWAACYADYKAKQDDPLRLHYGVVELPDDRCDIGSASEVIAARLGDGWQLLEVTSVFGPDGLEEREESAGEYFLRY